MHRRSSKRRRLATIPIIQRPMLASSQILLTVVLYSTIRRTATIGERRRSPRTEKEADKSRKEGPCCRPACTSFQWSRPFGFRPLSEKKGNK
ncbi:hypothetical protein Trydic_g13512 [Trypoxylus dichotomus]